jgi:sugar lactone lactonase YvrE/enterochelin esterase-like enzyme
LRRAIFGPLAKELAMMRSTVLALLTLLSCLLATAPSTVRGQAGEPKLTADSMPQPGVPEGRIEGPFEWQSQVFPGTRRNYWLYVPQQYDATKPACVFVVQDGLGRAKDWHLTTVMDNLIHKQEMPVTIGIFIEPGVVPATSEGAQPRFNRSFEYDSLGPRYARFLLEEILPEVGRKYALSSDANDRAIAGASSGAICAFTVAWERPDAFRRVFSTIGTYVGLRGGDVYPTWVRKFEPKPIRVYLQDGNRDLNIYAGDWWMANQSMLSSLRFAGYDVNHAWGEGGHDGKQGADILPDAMRWLWRDHPKPIEARYGGPDTPTELLIPGEDWQLVSEGHRFTEGPAVNARGELFFTDIPNHRIHKVDLQGKVQVFAENSREVNGLMFGADGYLYACQNGTKRIVRYDESGNEDTVLEDAPSNDLVTFARGGYYTDPTNHRVWYVDPQGNRSLADEGIDFPNGVILSADQQWLFVSDTHGRFTYSYQVQPDGKLLHKQEHGHLHLADGSNESGADGMTVDRDGRLYVTTRLGLQVLDQLGRVHLIIAKPQDAWLSNVVFGGPQLDTLYVTCGDKVYRRKIAAQGVVPWQPPVLPPKPRL